MSEKYSVGTKSYSVCKEILKNAREPELLSRGNTPNFINN